MNTFSNPYISRVRIKNYRNFLEADVNLEHKAVIIGENNVGKTNFLRAIQLILDRDFSDSDRQLSKSDFHDSLKDPMENGEVIEIIVNVRGFEHNSKLVAQFSDAIVIASPQTLEFRYRFFPVYDTDGSILLYSFRIYKGLTDDVPFTNEDRRYLNIYVVKALRDVEREMKANKNSPLYKLVKKYDIQKEELEAIAAMMKDAADGVLELDEICHIKKTIQERFTLLSGLQTDQEVHLRTFDVDLERLLYSVQVYMGIEERPVGELSLGLANILYVSLMLILLKDRTILPLMKKEKYDKLLEDDKAEILKRTYTASAKGNYLLNDELSSDLLAELYVFMDEFNRGNQQSFTILAVEEPESHLHPILQRLIYREVLHKSETSVLFTSHSTFIAAVSPLDSIVHIRRQESASKAFSTSGILLEEGDKKDIERYLDAKRGEIYFGKAVILAEGITEEYILPAAAEIQSTLLDDFGIIVCNVHSTNFKPYIQILEALHIPWVLFTDGDYYENLTTADPESGDEEENKKYHIMSTGASPNYKGNELIGGNLVKLGLLKEEDIPSDLDEQDTLFRTKGCYIGEYTLEVDMMKDGSAANHAAIKEIFSDLCGGKDTMKANFNALMDKKEYWTVLKRIEQYIGKGRFAQRMSGRLTADAVPDYISEGIKEIVSKVKKEHE